MTTLLKSNDINVFVNIPDADLPPCDLKSILQVELREFRNCLGSLFYETLKKDQVDYSAATAYTAKEYQIGEVAIYQGTIYEATAASETLPTDVNNWTKAPKFGTQCYEDLWCLFLGEFLSWSVVRNRIPFLRAKISGQGINTHFGDHFNAASDKSYVTLQKAIDNNIAMAFENMDQWMRQHDDAETCFGQYKGIATDCCSCGCSEKNSGCSCESSCVSAKKRKNKMRVA